MPSYKLYTYKCPGCGSSIKGPRDGQKGYHTAPISGVADDGARVSVSIECDDCGVEMEIDPGMQGYYSSVNAGERGP